MHVPLSHNLRGHVIPGSCNTIPEENGKGMLRLSGLGPHLGGGYSLYWPTQGGYTQIATSQGSKLKKSSGRLLATNWRNIVARCKFLVTCLYNVNNLMTQLIVRASDILRCRRAAKFTKTRKIPRNSVKILSTSEQHI